MGISKAPILNSFVSVKPISYTDITTMEGCLLRGMIKTRGIIDNQEKYSGVSKDLICGYIFHDLLYNLEKYGELDVNVRRKAVRDDIDLLIESYTKRYAEFSFRDYQYWPKLEKIISSIIKKSNKKQLNIIDREKRIKTKDAAIVGVIDLIENSSDGLVVVDYKSRTFIADSEIPSFYFEQLHFYALLIQEEYGDYPVKGYIEYFDTQRVLVELDNGYSEVLHEKAKSIYYQLKNVTTGYLSTKEIASFHINECDYCSVCYLCPELNKTILITDSGLSCFLLVEMKVARSCYIEFLVKSGIVCDIHSRNIIIKIHQEDDFHFVINDSYIFTNLTYIGSDTYELSSISKVYLK